MWVKQCHKPQICLGMVYIYISTIYGDDWGGGLLLFKPHSIICWIGCEWSLKLYYDYLIYVIWS